jgi:hypothetical protein
MEQVDELLQRLAAQIDANELAQPVVANPGAPNLE